LHFLALYINQFLIILSFLYISVNTEILEIVKNFVVGFGLLTLQVAFYFPKKNNFGKMKWFIVSFF